MPPPAQDAPSRGHLSPILFAALFAVMVSTAEHEALACDDGGAGRVALTGGVSLATGAAAALTSSGVIVASDESRDYRFEVGALVGIGVTAGLAGIYTLVDSSGGCRMAQGRPWGIAWEVVVTTTVIGALLPMAIWGASDERPSPQAEGANAKPAAFGVTLPFRF